MAKSRNEAGRDMRRAGERRRQAHSSKQAGDGSRGVKRDSKEGLEGEGGILQSCSWSGECRFSSVPMQ